MKLCLHVKSDFLAMEMHIWHEDTYNLKFGCFENFDFSFGIDR